VRQGGMQPEGNGAELLTLCWGGGTLSLADPCRLTEGA
jgi:hypothetical protein